MNSNQLKLVPSPDQKRCCVCKIIKPLTDFYKWSASKSGLNSHCKICHLARNKRDREANKEKYALQKKIYGQRPECQRRFREKTWANYGIKNADGSQFKIHDYDVMFAQQNGKCAICLKDEIGSKRSKHFFVDHDHKTGFVRWLLCIFCNQLLGNSKDNPEILERAARMLKEKQ